MIAHWSRVLMAADRFFIAFMSHVHLSWDLTGVATFFALLILGVGRHPLWQQIPAASARWVFLLVIGIGGTALAIQQIDPLRLATQPQQPTYLDRISAAVLYVFVGLYVFVLSAQITVETSVSQALATYIVLYLLLFTLLSGLRLISWISLVIYFHRNQP